MAYWVQMFDTQIWQLDLSPKDQSTVGRKLTQQRCLLNSTSILWPPICIMHCTYLGSLNKNTLPAQTFIFECLLTRVWNYLKRLQRLRVWFCWNSYAIVQQVWPFWRKLQVGFKTKNLCQVKQLCFSFCCQWIRIQLSNMSPAPCPPCLLPCSLP